MTDKPSFEIPETLRDMAQQNVEQARTAFTQLQAMNRQVQDMMTRSTGSMLDAAREMQSRALRFTEQNVEAGFTMAAELARARDLKDYLEIQARHTQRQMQNYTQQAQELGKLMADAAQRAQPRG